MGKGKVKGDEHVCRVNYLFQVGKRIAKSSPLLSQFYGKVLTVVTEKTAPKKDFTLKRSMCQKCHAVLSIGDNATYRVRKNKHKKGAPVMVIGCNLCGEKKRIPTDRRQFKLAAETKGKIIQNGSPYSLEPKEAKAASSSSSNEPVAIEISNKKELVDFQSNCMSDKTDKLGNDIT